MTKTPEHILQKIKEAKENGSKRINLSGSLNSYLTEIPPEVFELKQLEELSLQVNIIKEIPESIGKLQNLTSLDLSGNQLSTLPECIGNLQNLTSLDLQVNQLSILPESIGNLQKLNSLNLGGNDLIEIPESIGNLQKLTSLDLSNNQLSVLPESIGNLQKLTSLDLPANQLSALPESIGNLQNLTSLNLVNNSFEKIPTPIFQIKTLIYLNFFNLALTYEHSENNIKEVPRDILKLINLKELDLRDNPIENPPPEVAYQGIEAIRNYYRDLDRGYIKNYEAKLIFVGNGRVGKTSLSRRLDDDEFNENEPFTHGIRIVPFKLSLSDEIELKLNMWDFGGQEIYHATHRFFLTARALYLFVWDVETRHNAEHSSPTEPQDFNFKYWLDNVQALSSSSPVVMVQNKIDQKKGFVNNREELVQQYNVTGFYDVSAKTNKNIDHLRQIIKEQFSENERLKGVIGYNMPISWLNVRQKLEKLAKEKNYIYYEEYLRICDEEGLTAESAQTLCRFLHEIAVILHFLKLPKLSSIVIINPNWAVELVYKIINETVKQNGGKFDQAHINEILEDFTEEAKKNFTQLLMKFELCFADPHEEGVFIAPQFLPTKKPAGFDMFLEDYQRQTKLIYHYPRFMHKSIMIRFLAQFGKEATKQFYWRDGILIKKYGTFALVEADRAKRQIFVKILTVQGQTNPQLLTKIYKVFKEINRNMEVEISVPCRCSLCKESDDPHLYQFESLLNFRSDKKQCDKSGELINIRDLIDIQFDSTEHLTIQEEMMSKRKGVKLFISYAHKDEDFKDELRAHLSGLKQKGLIKEWDDRAILPGQVWDDEIKQNLNEADIILFLVSSAFMASGYINDVELKRAIARHKKGEVLIIPIVVRACDLSSLAISKFQALPKNAKPISSWDDPDEAYVDVVQQLKRVIKNI